MTYRCSSPLGSENSTSSFSSPINHNKIINHNHIIKQEKMEKMQADRLCIQTVCGCLRPLKSKWQYLMFPSKLSPEGKKELWKQLKLEDSGALDSVVPGTRLKR